MISVNLLLTKVITYQVSKGTGADQRFVKNAFKNAECHPFFLEIVLLIFFLTHTGPTLPTGFTD